MPETLLLHEDYMVESLIEGSSLVSEAIDDVFPSFGRILSVMHSVKTKGFGGFGDQVMTPRKSPITDVKCSSRG